VVCDGYHEGGIYKLNIAPCVSYIASEDRFVVPKVQTSEPRQLGEEH